MTEADPARATAGGLLRAARERQGLHIAALAASIKVAPRKLEALEGDRHDELPDATFVRALAQTVCRTLKIDARPVLDLLPPAPSMVVLQPGSGGLGTPFRDRPGRVEPRLNVGAMRPLLVAAAVLVVAALVLVLLPPGWLPRLGGADAPVAQGAASAAQATPAMAMLPASAAGLEAPGASAASTEPVFAPAPTASEPAASAPVAAATSPLTAPVAPAAIPSASLAQLRSSGNSWVEVRDGRGQLLLSRTVLAGESVDLDGQLPLRLVIGNAAVTQLAFKGQPVDLAARTRDNVARVELQ